MAYDGLDLKCRRSRPMKSHASTAIQVYREPPWEERGQRDYQLFRLPAWASRYATFGHPSVLAIGNFDGIHLGHQAILRATVERARALNAVSRRSR